jgi:hypothetical protein
MKDKAKYEGMITPESRAIILDSFTKRSGNISAVSREVGCSRSTVRRNIAKVGVGKKPIAGGKKKSAMITALLPKGEGIQRYILTSAQNNTHVHSTFWNNLLAMAKHYDALIMVGTFSYNQNSFGKLAVKAGTAKAVEHELWFDPLVKPYINDKRTQLAPGLVWCGEMNIQPTEENPLSGFETYAGPDSAIFPHTKIEMRSIATTQDVPVKLLYTTGTVTQMNYIQKKAGLKAEHHHRYAFLIVEVDSDGRWWVRQVAARKNGRVIQDLNVRVVDGVVSKANVAAITWGDLHMTMSEPTVVEASHDMLDTLMPEYQFIHDLLEGASINRHVRKHKDSQEKFSVWLRGLHRVDEELRRTRLVLETYLRPGCQTIIPDANHDRQWLKLWLCEFDYRNDPGNAELFLRLQKFMYDEMRAGKLPKNVNLMERAFVKETGLAQGAVRFLLPDESFIVKEIECGQHGHRGPNGQFGNPQNLSKVGTKMTTGHTHVASIVHGLYVAGTSTKLTKDWGYTAGPSAWTHSHVVLYENGQRTVITLKDGKWRA